MYHFGANNSNQVAININSNFDNNESTPSNTGTNQQILQQHSSYNSSTYANSNSSHHEDHHHSTTTCLTESSPKDSTSHPHSSYIDATAHQNRNQQQSSSTAALRQWRRRNTNSAGQIKQPETTPTSSSPSSVTSNHASSPTQPITPQQHPQENRYNPSESSSQVRTPASDQIKPYAPQPSYIPQQSQPLIKLQQPPETAPSCINTEHSNRYQYFGPTSHPIDDTTLSYNTATPPYSNISCNKPSVSSYPLVNNGKIGPSPYPRQNYNDTPNSPSVMNQQYYPKTSSFYPDCEQTDYRKRLYNRNIPESNHSGGLFTPVTGPICGGDPYPTNYPQQNHYNYPPPGNPWYYHQKKSLPYPAYYPNDDYPTRHSDFPSVSENKEPVQNFHFQQSSSCYDPSPNWMQCCNNSSDASTYYPKQTPQMPSPRMPSSSYHHPSYQPVGPHYATEPIIPKPMPRPHHPPNPQMISNGNVCNNPYLERKRYFYDEYSNRNEVYSNPITPIKPHPLTPNKFAWTNNADLHQPKHIQRNYPCAVNNPATDKYPFHGYPPSGGPLQNTNQNYSPLYPSSVTRPPQTANEWRPQKPPQIEFQQPHPSRMLFNMHPTPRTELSSHRVPQIISNEIYNPNNSNSIHNSPYSGYSNCRYQPPLSAEIDFENHIKINELPASSSRASQKIPKLNLKEFLETWDENNEELEENATNLPDVVLSSNKIAHTNKNHLDQFDSNDMMLYVLETTNIPEETVWSDYKHVQQIDKLPDNIKIVPEIVPNPTETKSTESKTDTPNIRPHEVKPSDEHINTKLLVNAQNSLDSPDSSTSKKDHQIRCDTVIKSPDTTVHCLTTPPINNNGKQTLTETDNDVVSSTCNLEIVSIEEISKKIDKKIEKIAAETVHSPIVTTTSNVVPPSQKIIDFETKDITETHDSDFENLNDKVHPGANKVNRKNCTGECNIKSKDKCEQCEKTDELLKDLISSNKTTTDDMILDLSGEEKRFFNYYDHSNLDNIMELTKSSQKLNDFSKNTDLPSDLEAVPLDLTGDRPDRNNFHVTECPTVIQSTKNFENITNIQKSNYLDLNNTSFETKNVPTVEATVNFSSNYFENHKNEKKVETNTKLPKTSNATHLSSKKRKHKKRKRLKKMAASMDKNYKYPEKIKIKLIKNSQGDFEKIEVISTNTETNKFTNLDQPKDKIDIDEEILQLAAEQSIKIDLNDTKETGMPSIEATVESVSINTQFRTQKEIESIKKSEVCNREEIPVVDESNFLEKFHKNIPESIILNTKLNEVESEKDTNFDMVQNNASKDHHSKVDFVFSKETTKESTENYKISNEKEVEYDSVLINKRIVGSPQDNMLEKNVKIPSAGENQILDTEKTQMRADENEISTNSPKENTISHNDSRKSTNCDESKISIEEDAESPLVETIQDFQSKNKENQQLPEAVEENQEDVNNTETKIDKNDEQNEEQPINGCENIDCLERQSTDENEIATVNTKIQNDCESTDCLKSIETNNDETNKTDKNIESLSIEQSLPSPTIQENFDTTKLSDNKTVIYDFDSSYPIEKLETDSESVNSLESINRSTKIYTEDESPLSQKSLTSPTTQENSNTTQLSDDKSAISGSDLSNPIENLETDFLKNVSHSSENYTQDELPLNQKSLTSPITQENSNTTELSDDKSAISDSDSSNPIENLETDSLKSASHSSENYTEDESPLSQKLLTSIMQETSNTTELSDDRSAVCDSDPAKPMQKLETDSLKSVSHSTENYTENESPLSQKSVISPTTQENSDITELSDNKSAICDLDPSDPIEKLETDSLKSVSQSSQNYIKDESPLSQRSLTFPTTQENSDITELSDNRSAICDLNLSNPIEKLETDSLKSVSHSSQNYIKDESPLSQRSLTSPTTQENSETVLLSDDRSAVSDTSSSYSVEKLETDSLKSVSHSSENYTQNDESPLSQKSLTSHTAQENFDATELSEDRNAIYDSDSSDSIEKLETNSLKSVSHSTENYIEDESPLSQKSLSSPTTQENSDITELSDNRSAIYDSNSAYSVEKLDPDSKSVSQGSKYYTEDESPLSQKSLTSPTTQDNSGKPELSDDRSAIYDSNPSIPIEKLETDSLKSVSRSPKNYTEDESLLSQKSFTSPITQEKSDKPVTIYDSNSSYLIEKLETDSESTDSLKNINSTNNCNEDESLSIQKSQTFTRKNSDIELSDDKNPVYDSDSYPQEKLTSSPIIQQNCDNIENNYKTEENNTNTSAICEYNDFTTKNKYNNPEQIMVLNCVSEIFENKTLIHLNTKIIEQISQNLSIDSCGYSTLETVNENFEIKENKNTTEEKMEISVLTEEKSQISNLTSEDNVIENEVKSPETNILKDMEPSEKLDDLDNSCSKKESLSLEQNNLDDTDYETEKETVPNKELLAHAQTQVTERDSCYKEKDGELKNDLVDTTMEKNLFKEDFKEIDIENEKRDIITEDNKEGEVSNECDNEIEESPITNHQEIHTFNNLSSEETEIDVNDVNEEVTIGFINHSNSDSNNFENDETISEISKDEKISKNLPEIENIQKSDESQLSSNSLENIETVSEISENKTISMEVSEIKKAVNVEIVSEISENHETSNKMILIGESPINEENSIELDSSMVESSEAKKNEDEQTSSGHLESVKTILEKENQSETIIILENCSNTTDEDIENTNDNSEIEENLTVQVESNETLIFESEDGNFILENVILVDTDLVADENSNLDSDLSENLGNADTEEDKSLTNDEIEYFDNSSNMCEEISHEEVIEETEDGTEVESANIQKIPADTSKKNLTQSNEEVIEEAEDDKQVESTDIQKIPNISKEETENFTQEVEILNNSSVEDEIEKVENCEETVSNDKENSETNLNESEIAPENLILIVESDLSDEISEFDSEILDSSISLEENNLILENEDSSIIVAYDDNEVDQLEQIFLSDDAQALECFEVIDPSEIIDEHANSSSDNLESVEANQNDKTEENLIQNENSNGTDQDIDLWLCTEEEVISEETDVKLKDVAEKSSTNSDTNNCEKSNSSSNSENDRKEGPENTISSSVIKYETCSVGTETVAHVSRSTSPIDTNRLKSTKSTLNIPLKELIVSCVKIDVNIINTSKKGPLRENSIRRSSNSERKRSYNSECSDEDVSQPKKVCFAENKSETNNNQTIECKIDCLSIKNEGEKLENLNTNDSMYENSNHENKLIKSQNKKPKKFHPYTKEENQSDLSDPPTSPKIPESPNLDNIEKNNNSFEFSNNNTTNKSRVPPIKVKNHPSFSEILSNIDSYVYQQKKLSKFKIPKFKNLNTEHNKKITFSSSTDSQSSKPDSSSDNTNPRIKIKLKNISKHRYNDTDDVAPDKKLKKDKKPLNSKQYEIINKDGVTNPKSQLISVGEKTSGKFILKNKKFPKMVIKRTKSIDNQTQNDNSVLLNNALKWQPFVKLEKDMKLDKMALKKQRQKRIILKINRVHKTEHNEQNLSSNSSLKCKIRLDKYMLPSVISNYRYN